MAKKRSVTQSPIVTSNRKDPFTLESVYLSSDDFKQDTLSQLRTVEDFCDKEMVAYGKETCMSRAIPSYIDGLKESTRKVVWCAKDNLKTPLKVFQFSGIVAYKMAYLHGDLSLNKAVTGLAQKFNSDTPILTGLGQFGDYHFRASASPRYVSVVLSDIFKYIFKDNDLLTPRVSDGIECEPDYMIPIIPFSLCMNITGIAMAFASTIYSRDIQALTEECIKVLQAKQEGVSYIPSNLPPKLPGFLGTCSATSPNTPTVWNIKGIWHKKSDKKILIQEYIGETEDFTSRLNDLEDAGLIRWCSVFDPSITDKALYEVTLCKNTVINDDLLKKLKLKDTLTENLTMTDENKNIVIFDNVSQIIDRFVSFRLSFYDQHKQNKLESLKYDLKKATNRLRFITDSDKYRDVKDVEAALEADKFDRLDDSFEYLLSIRIDSITKAKRDKLAADIKAIKSSIKMLQATAPITLYMNDLQELHNYIVTKVK